MKYTNPNFDMAVIAEDRIIPMNTMSGKFDVRPLPFPIADVNESIFYNDSIVLATTKGIVVVTDDGAAVKEFTTNWTSITMVNGVCALAGITNTGTIAFTVLDCDKLAKFSSRTLGRATSTPRVIIGKDNKIFIMDGKRLIDAAKGDTYDVESYDTKYINGETITVGSRVTMTLGPVEVINLLPAVKTAKLHAASMTVIDKNHFHDGNAIYKITGDEDNRQAAKLYTMRQCSKVVMIDDTFVSYSGSTVRICNEDVEQDFDVADTIKSVVKFNVSDSRSKHLNGHKVDQVIELVVGGDVTIDPTLETPLKDFVNNHGVNHTVDLVEAAGLMYTISGEIVPIIFDNDSQVAGIYECTFDNGVFTLGNRTGSINLSYIEDDNDEHASNWELHNVIVDVLWF